MTAARLAAARTLLSIGQRETTLGSALDAGEAGADVRDRGLFMELATGTLRWQRELDALIAAVSQRPAREIEPSALVVLRMGAYQLRHLDRIPPHAVVSESVETVRALGAPRAAGFVNAVLRSMIRRGPALALPKRPGGDGTRQTQIAYLSITLSHPAWLVGRWLDRVGFEGTERWCRFNNTAPSVTVRSLSGAQPVENHSAVARGRARRRAGAVCRGRREAACRHTRPSPRGDASRALGAG